MHIALVSDDYPPLTLISGIGTYTRALAQGLVDVGHRVTAVSWAPGSPTVEHDRGVQIRRIAPVGSHVFGQRFALPVRQSMGVYAELRRIHREDPIDVVEFAEGTLAAATTAFSNIPTIVRGHGSPATSMYWENAVLDDYRTRIYCAVEAFGLRHADLIVAISAYMEQIYRDLYGLSPDVLAMEHLALSAPESFLDSNGYQPNRHAQCHDVTFIYAGRQSWRKRPHLVVEAFARVRMPEKQLIMVGHDTDTVPGGSSMRQYCRELAIDLGVLDRVQFVDRVAQEELLDYYHAGDVLVAPSLYETFGLVYLEAMAAGLPVIGSTTGAAPELIPPDSGLLVPPDDPDVLAAAMERLGRDVDLRRSMGEAGREWVRTRYRQDNHVKAMIGWYSHAIQRNRTLRQCRAPLHLLGRP